MVKAKRKIISSKKIKEISFCLIAGQIVLSLLCISPDGEILSMTIFWALSIVYLVGMTEMLYLLLMVKDWTINIEHKFLAFTISLLTIVVIGMFSSFVNMAIEIIIANAKVSGMVFGILAVIILWIFINLQVAKKVKVK